MFNEEDNRRKNTGSENTDANTTGDGIQRNTSKQYKNIETSVDDKNYFNDDYASRQEEQISNDEAASGKDRRPGA